MIVVPFVSILSSCHLVNYIWKPDPSDHSHTGGEKVQGRTSILDAASWSIRTGCQILFSCFLRCLVNRCKKPLNDAFNMVFQSIKILVSLCQEGTTKEGCTHNAQMISQWNCCNHCCDPFRAFCLYRTLSASAVGNSKTTEQQCRLMDLHLSYCSHKKEFWRSSELTK